MDDKKLKNKIHCRRYYLKNSSTLKKKIATRARKRNEKRTRILRAVRKFMKCECCGYDDVHEILQFHHRNPSEKKVSLASRRPYGWKKFWDEILKCDILCPNCHSTETLIQRGLL